MRRFTGSFAATFEGWLFRATAGLLPSLEMGDVREKGTGKWGDCFVVVLLLLLLPLLLLLLLLTTTTFPFYFLFNLSQH